MAAGSRKRILHVGKFFPPHRGGIESYLESLCCGLVDEFAVEVLVANDRPKSLQEDWQQVHIHRLASLGVLKSQPLTPGLPFLLRRTKADLVHLHYPNPGALLSALFVPQNIPLVITHHSDIVNQQALARLFQPVDCRIYRRAAAVIASSPPYVESSPLLGQHRKKTTVVPFGITPLSASPASEVEDIRQRYGKKLIVAVGRLVYYKGYQYAIEAMKEVDAQLLIIGTGPLETKLREQIARDNLEGRVQLLGHVEDITPYLSAADIFTMPSTARSEAFGISQIEALSLGKPIVTTSLRSGVPWVAQGANLVVPPEDSPALAQAYTKLFKNPELHAQLSAAATKRYQDEFRRETMIERTKELYKKLLAGKGPHQSTELIS
ncbi:MAG: glycosyltransferase [Polyangiaceae bacterium]|nr:glycosyltransferase [Polyangiaceae bacterium]